MIIAQNNIFITCLVFYIGLDFAWMTNKTSSLPLRPFSNYNTFTTLLVSPVIQSDFINPFFRKKSIHISFVKMVKDSVNIVLCCSHRIVLCCSYRIKISRVLLSGLQLGETPSCSIYGMGGGPLFSLCMLLSAGELQIQWCDWNWQSIKTRGEQGNVVVCEEVNSVMVQ